jgi:CBS domain-containing protein
MPPDNTIGPTRPEKILAATRSFAGVSGEAIQRVVANSALCTLAAGSTLFQPGDEYRGVLYILVEGTIVMHRPSGRHDNVQPGDFVGLANYLDNQDYTATAVATTRSTVAEIQSVVFQRLEREEPELFNALNRIVATKLRDRSPDRSISSGALAQPVTRVMKAPVTTCRPDTTLVDAFHLMQERRIGSLVVTDDQGTLRGLVTYEGLAESMLFGRGRPQDTISDAACNMPRVIPMDTPLWEAEEIQKRHHEKYLVVAAEDTPVGIVSQTDILHTLISRPSILTSRIRKADSLAALADLRGQLADVAADARETHHRPSDAVRLLSETHLALQRRAIELTLATMERDGWGGPPTEFAVLIMGSGGRREMMLDPDQDNGLIIADSQQGESEAVGAWFKRFARRMTEGFDHLGYMLCPGDIMASNPMYRKTLAQWKQQISHIIERPTEKAARWSNIVLDFDTLYGKEALTTELRRHVLSWVQQNPRLLKMMADHDAEGRPAIGFFNQLISTTRDDGGERIDIKRNGLRIIADAARIFALQNGVAVENTTDRLNALVRVGKLSADFKTSIQEAYEELLDLLINHQIEQSRRQQPLDKLIDPATLTAQTRSRLRVAMRATKRFQERLQDDYATAIF